MGVRALRTQMVTVDRVAEQQDGPVLEPAEVLGLAAVRMSSTTAFLLNALEIDSWPRSFSMSCSISGSFARPASLRSPMAGRL
jgi:hypothetical protein